jgi:energy-converting hydrogenase Eha subunit A
MDSGLDWQQVLLWSTALSLAAVIATIVAVPWVVARLPPDYFCRPRRFAWRKSSPEPLLARVLTVVKNLLGSLLVLLGVVMLVTPGQGLLTLLAGLLLMNFPGKYRLERWLELRPGILRGLNWLRQRQKQAPFESPPLP